MIQKRKMKKPNNCAILIAAKSGSAFLPEQLASLDAQVNAKIDIFYSCDGPDISSEEILDSVNAHNQNPQQLAFNSSAANFFHLIKNADLSATHDYVFLCDQDDIWLPNKINRAVHCLKKYNASCYSSSYYTWSPDNNKIKYRYKSVKQTPLDFYFRSPGPGFTYCFTKDAFQKVRSELSRNDLSNIRWHDWTIYAIARSISLAWYIDKAPNSLYRLHENNDTGQLSKITDILPRLSFLLGGKYEAQVRKIAAIANNGNESARLIRLNLSDRIWLMSKVSLLRFTILERIALIIFLIFTKRNHHDSS